MENDAYQHISLWIKVPYTLFVFVLVPVYWVQYGPANFLWFSDIALLVTMVALWRASRFLASMMAVGVLLPEIGWNIDFFAALLLGHAPVGIAAYMFDFFAALLLGHAPVGIAAYMFDPEIPLYLRALSGFHFALPPLLLWMLYRLGYDHRAWKAQTLLTWIVLPLSRVFSTPEHNVNWVYGPGDLRQTWVPDPVYIGFLMVLSPLVFYLPTHLLLKHLFAR